MKKTTAFVLMCAAVSMMVPNHVLAVWGKAETKTESGNADMKLGDYKGLKHAIGCKDFDNQAGWSGSYDLGKNLSVLLESALFDSGRFVIVEREKLETVVAEQDLAASGRAAKAKNVAKTGVLRSAKYIATGALAEVTENQSGGGAGLNTKFGRIGFSGSEAQVVVIVKLIDSSSGELVAKERIVGKAGNKALGLSGLNLPGYTPSVDLSGFKKTPIGQAAQDCINQAAALIAKKMEDIPFEGSVIKVSNSGQVIVNRGSEFGMEIGQELLMAEEGEVMMDPDSGAMLGKEEGAILGKIKVVKVAEKMAYCDVLEGEKKPKAGTVVKAAK